MEIQLAYFDALMTHLNKIVPPEKRHLYHLIFGSRIIDSFNTAKEMIYVDKTVHKYLACARYYPIHNLSTKIQALWRGYHYRCDAAG
jgi:hypothetical protein